MTAHMPNGNLFLVVIVCLTMLQILCLITIILVQIWKQSNQMLFLIITK